MRDIELLAQFLQAGMIPAIASADGQVQASALTMAQVHKIVEALTIAEKVLSNARHAN